MSIWARMKSKIQKEDEKQDSFQIPIPIKKPDIGGISRSKLSVYRDRFKKDGTVKYPPQWLDKLNQGDGSFLSEYHD
jgi:hypothetical protein